MARDDHNEYVKAINSVSRMGLKTYYKLSKELPPSVKFQCTYKQKELDRTSIENQVVEDDMRTNNYMDDTDHSPHDNQTSQSTVSSPPTNTAGSPTITCDGAYVEIADCLQEVMVKIFDFVKRKGKTMEEAMEGDFLIMCPDRAVHPKKTSSRGLQPGFNIIPHTQLRVKESTETLCSILQFRTRDLPSALSDIPLLSDCCVYDLADGKALYLLLGHSHWGSHDYPFLLCKCDRQENTANKCTGIMSDAEYICLAKL